MKTHNLQEINKTKTQLYWVVFNSILLSSMKTHPKVGDTIVISDGVEYTVANVFTATWVNSHEKLIGVYENFIS